MTNEAITHQPNTHQPNTRDPASSRSAPASRPAPECTPADRVTKSLLGYGVIAGPFYLVVALAQAFTREGFDLARHQWSLLANGGPGWIQIANFVVTGLMVIAFAVGLRRAIAPGIGARWAPILIGLYGASLVAAGAFRADPALGFPVGTPEGPCRVGEAGAQSTPIESVCGPLQTLSDPVSWHGLLHFAVGGIGFTCLAIACFVMARRFSAEGSRSWAVSSRVTGIVFVATFAMLASSGGLPVANLLFTAAVILVWAWMSAVAVNRYRTV
jgi:hypothetical protein